MLQLRPRATALPAGGGGRSIITSSSPWRLALLKSFLLGACVGLALQHQLSLCTWSSTSSSTLTTTQQEEQEQSTTRLSSLAAVPDCWLPSLLSLCRLQQQQQHASSLGNNNHRNSIAVCVTRAMETGKFLPLPQSSSFRPHPEAQKFIKKLRESVQTTGSAKVSIGASRLVTSGFISSDRNELDLFSAESWMHVFSDTMGAGRLGGLFAEHVLEHFAPVQVEHVAALAFLFLAPGARFRIAVPDGYMNDDAFALYIRAGTTPSGNGQEHMVAWTKDTLPPILESMGFEIQLQEWCEADGAFRSAWPPFSVQDGQVRRSIRFDQRNEETNAYKSFHHDDSSSKKNASMISYEEYIDPKGLKFVSLIFDAVKPLNCPAWVNN